MSRADDIRESRRYWVWVTGPDYYLEDDDTDRVWLEPGMAYVKGEWWTCHKDTQAGDLVLMYRSQKRRDIAYLIETRTDAYSLRAEPDAEESWKWGCDFEVVTKFETPLTLAEMKADRTLAEWGALRANFQKQVYEIPPDIWEHLLDRVGTSPEELERSQVRIDKNHRTLESEIETRLAEDPRVFRAHGLELEFLRRQYPGIFGGRADLLYRETSENRYVVVELKRGIVGRGAVAQALSYRASVAEEFKQRRRPLALVIGNEMDDEAHGIVKSDKWLRFIPLNELI